MFESACFNCLVSLRVCIFCSSLGALIHSVLLKKEFLGKGCPNHSWARDGSQEAQPSLLLPSPTHTVLLDPPAEGL